MLVTTGAVRSTLMLLTPAVELLPAMSKTVADQDWLAPSPNMCGDGLACAKPDSASAVVNDSVGAPVLRLYQPVAAAGLSSDAVIDGGVRSILTPLTVALALLPATSVM